MSLINNFKGFFLKSKEKVDAFLTCNSPDTNTVHKIRMDERKIERKSILFIYQWPDFADDTNIFSNFFC